MMNYLGQTPKLFQQQAQRQATREKEIFSRVACPLYPKTLSKTFLHFSLSSK